MERRFVPNQRYTDTMQDATDELAQKYARRGHPTADELIASQGLAFPRDPHALPGDFWPEEESNDDFLSAMHQLRGHMKPFATATPDSAIMKSGTLS